MSPYRKYIGIQIGAAFLWLAGVTVLIGNNLRDYAAVWFVLCAIVGFSSYLVRCPRCRMSVGLSHLNGFFAARRRLVCSRCELDLKAPASSSSGTS